MLNLPLNVASDEWVRQYDHLMQDVWLRTKLDRTRRIESQLAYLQDHAAPELNMADRTPKGKAVIDLGCGPGELLEIARYYGHEIYGVDAAGGVGGMGDAYLQASALSCERQDIPTYRWGFSSWVDTSFPALFKGRCALINSRGSWEQMHSDFMLGTPHDQHHRADLMNWSLGGQVLAAMKREFGILKSCLHPEGCILIHCNRAANHKQFEPLLLETADGWGLRLVKQIEGLYKWRIKSS